MRIFIACMIPFHSLHTLINVCDSLSRYSKIQQIISRGIRVPSMALRIEDVSSVPILRIRSKQYFSQKILFRREEECVKEIGGRYSGSASSHLLFRHLSSEIEIPVLRSYLQDIPGAQGRNRILMYCSYCGRQKSVCCSCSSYICGKHGCGEMNDGGLCNRCRYRFPQVAWSHHC